METYMTCAVTEELESLRQYLATQPTALHVNIDSPVPADRYLIPQSLILIIQHAQRYNHYPLHISISFLKYTVEISYPIQPRQTPDETYQDIETLVTIYRNFFNLPSIQQNNNVCTISIPLFI